MGQKTNPISNRIGITRGWDSNWCGGNYAEKIAEDYKIREYLGNRFFWNSLAFSMIQLQVFSSLQLLSRVRLFVTP